jgi:hypothetical protein
MTGHRRRASRGTVTPSGERRRWSERRVRVHLVPNLGVAIRSANRLVANSRFNARDALLNLYGGDFTSGNQKIYGIDADLQLHLAPRSSDAKMYLFGGAGWYREQTYLRQVPLEYATFCDPYFCAAGHLPILTAAQRTTSPGHGSWNAGIGLPTKARPRMLAGARFLSKINQNSSTDGRPL